MRAAKAAGHTGTERKVQKELTVIFSCDILKQNFPFGRETIPEKVLYFLTDRGEKQMYGSG